MVKITPQENGTLVVSGKTFEHKETLKRMGAMWQPKDKTWIVENTGDIMKQLKSLKAARRCGHCGEAGHFKPACEKYHDERKRELVEKARQLRETPGWKFKRFAHTGYCKCTEKPESFGYEGFSVLMPVTCGACSHWCCHQASPMDDGNNINYFRFNCPYHGNSIEQMLNDTRGT
jgi:hypothetical protein